MESNVALQSDQHERTAASLLQLIESFEKKAKPQQLILARYYTITHKPALKITNNQYRWILSWKGCCTGQSDIEISLLMECEPLLLSITLEA